MPESSWLKNKKSCIHIKSPAYTCIQDFYKDQQLLTFCQLGIDMNSNVFAYYHAA
jgi:hypothetical protein